MLELLVVLAILGLVAGLVVGGRPRSSDSTNAKETADILASTLREARSLAISQGRPIGFVLDTANHRFGLGKKPDHDLPAGLRLSLLTGRGDVVAPGLGRVRFFPDGSSTGGRIDIESSARKMAVGIDWLSGRVSIADRR